MGNDNTLIYRQCIPSSSLTIATSSSKRFPHGALWTRFNDIKGIIVRGFCHARVKGLAYEIYNPSKRFAEVLITKRIDYKLEEKNGSDLE